MVTFQKIKKDSMPPSRPRAYTSTARQREYEGYILALKAGEAGKLEPEDGETTRGLAVRLTRAASRLGKAVDVRAAEDAVYFALAD